MSISQKINCHLSTDETIFAQIIKLDGRLFAAQVSSICTRGKALAQKDHQWLPCPESKTALSVFKTILETVASQCRTLGDRRLVMISNPDGWLLVSKAEQKAIAGNDVAVVGSPPEGLINIT
jgi:hypothetical protein